MATDALQYEHPTPLKTVFDQDGHWVAFRVGDVEAMKAEIDGLRESSYSDEFVRRLYEGIQRYRSLCERVATVMGETDIEMAVERLETKGCPE